MRLISTWSIRISREQDVASQPTPATPSPHFNADGWGRDSSGSKDRRTVLIHTASVSCGGPTAVHISPGY